MFYKKLVAGDSYQPHAQAKSNVVLFKATDTSAKLSEDYGLAEVCLLIFFLLFVHIFKKM